VKTSKGDELPDEPEFAEFPDIITFLFSGEACCAPVETWREVVGEPLLRVDGVDGSGELFCLVIDGFLCFHPVMSDAIDGMTHHKRSAYGAYAMAREMQASVPPW